MERDDEKWKQRGSTVTLITKNNWDRWLRVELNAGEHREGGRAREVQGTHGACLWLLDIQCYPHEWDTKEYRNTVMFAADTVCDNSSPNPDKRAPGLLQSFSCSANAHVFILYGAVSIQSRSQRLRSFWSAPSIRSFPVRWIRVTHARSGNELGIHIQRKCVQRYTIPGFLVLSWKILAIGLHRCKNYVTIVCPQLACSLAHWEFFRESGAWHRPCYAWRCLHGRLDVLRFMLIFIGNSFVVKTMIGSKEKNN